MRHLAKIQTILSLLTAATLTTAYGQPAGQLFTFDEYGNGIFNGKPLSGVTLAADPSGGVAGQVLVYTLPFASPIGDVALIEPGQTGGAPLSDVVRFWDAPGATTQVIFYSDFSANDPADAPADVGLPSQLNILVRLNEIGPEGANGAIYTPGAGDPGFVPGIQYEILSDGVVPEPRVLSLAALGGGLLLWRKRQNRSASA